MDGQILDLSEDHDAEEKPERAHDEAEQQEMATVPPADGDLAEVGNHEACFSSTRVLTFGRRRGQRVRRGEETGQQNAEQQHGNDPECYCGYRKTPVTHAVGSFGGEISATLRDAADECQRKPFLGRLPSARVDTLCGPS